MDRAVAKERCFYPRCGLNYEHTQEIELLAGATVKQKHKKRIDGANDVLGQRNSRVKVAVYCSHRITEITAQRYVRSNGQIYVPDATRCRKVLV